MPLRKSKKIDFLEISLFAHIEAVKEPNTTKNGNSKKNRKIEFSQWPCKWSKNVFRGERTLVRCFFFRGWIMVKVSHTLKNPLFWFPKTWILVYFLVRERPKGVFCINNVSIHKYKNRKNCQKFKILLETWRITSGLSADSFMDL